ncbi:MAG: serine/threonine protein kinase [Planctomycetes bacterium]|nr:serine/threonine protein kinase [Planctomycetota bacterium]
MEGSIAQTLKERYPHLVLAFQRKQITKHQIQEAIKVQQSLKLSGTKKSLEEVLVEKGYLTKEQLTQLTREAPPKPKGNLFGDYELMGVIGTGGMGTVYKARQVHLDRIIALKILHGELAQNQELLLRFQREARAVAKLNHPNIVVGIDVGVNMGRHFLAMEFVEGESLDKRLARNGGTVSEHDAMDICRQIAEALHHAHERNYVHRDVKPENIMMTFDGVAKLMDLGLARALGPQFQPLTKDGLAVGTPHYISPEQAQGERDLTPGTDLYSLGVVLFQCVTGQLPFEAEHFSDVMLKHVNDPPPDPRTLNPTLSDALAQVILKLLKKNPNERYPTGQALAEELQRLLNGEAPMLVKAPPPPKRPQKPDGTSPTPTQAEAARKRKGHRFGFEGF